MDPLIPPPPFPPFPTAPSAPTSASPFPSSPEQPPNHEPPAQNRVPNYPSYAEMIYAAITALNEREGSSKRAISKYIEKAYSSCLQPNHQALLTHHLKRLKNSGLLVMVKKSYMFPPRSDDLGATLPQAFQTGPIPPLFQPGPPMQQQVQDFFAHDYQAQVSEQQQVHGFVQGDAFSVPGLVGDVSGASSGVKRGRGRPPKLRNLVEAAPGFGFPVQHQQHQTVGDVSEPNGAAQPVFVALGLADDPANVVKRRPGRPKKFLDGDGVAGLGIGAGSLPVKRGRGRPPRTGPGKLGRPRKPKSLASGVKRGPGRPPKTQAQSQSSLVNVPFAVDPALLSVPRPRGRPRKAAVPGVGGVVPMKRPGYAVNRPRKSTGRPVGRPRKNALGTTEAQNSQLQVEAYEDLKRKLEFFQSRIMQAVGVLKPELTNESAIGALQELEGLASMDITTPFREDPLPSVPQM